MAGALSDAKDKGNQLFKQGDYVGAISAYSVGLDAETTVLHMASNRASCIALRTNRALCFLLLKQFDECFRDCTAALTLDPKCFKALYRRAKASQANGNYQQAVKDYRQILNDSICPKESIRSNVASLLAETIDLISPDDDCQPPLPTTETKPECTKDTAASASSAITSVATYTDLVETDPGTREMPVPASFDDAIIGTALKTQGYYCVDNFLPKLEFEAVLKDTQKVCAAKSVLTRARLTNDTRLDLCCDVNPFDPRWPHLSRLCRMLQFGVARRLVPVLKVPLFPREQTQFALYPGEGSFYTQHLDNPKAMDAEQDNFRVVTIMFYFNTHWTGCDGGELRVHTGVEGGKGFVDFAPLGNRMIIFMSDRILHEVRPSYKQRSAIAVWLSDRMS